jgi:hypothetical protein
MVNGVIKAINFVIGIANKVPGININPLGEVSFSMPSFSVGAPPRLARATYKTEPTQASEAVPHRSASPTLPSPTSAAAQPVAVAVAHRVPVVVRLKASGTSQRAASKTSESRQAEPSSTSLPVT